MPRDWTAVNDADPSPGIDPTVPSTARVYDALLGGRDHFKPDREAADVFLSLVPHAREAALVNRDAFVRGVQYMVREAGIDQILDIGCGLLTKQRTHEVAQEIDPEVRVVYVDKDPMALTHGRALMATDPATTVVTGDLRDPAGILADPQVRAGLDFERPVGLIVWMLMQVAEAEDPDEIVATLLAPLASGSHLFIVTWPDTGDPAQRALSQACLETLGNGWARPVERIREHFQGLPLVAPGLEFVPRWYPEDPGRDVPSAEELKPFERTQIAGIAVKP